MNENDTRKSQLLNYLYLYQTKGLRIEWIINSMIKSLNNNEKITPNEFNSVIKFLERERPFYQMSRREIKQYFKYLIGQRFKKENHNDINLYDIIYGQSAN